MVFVFVIDDLSEEECASMKTWLKFNIEPKDTLVSYMVKTCKARASWLRENQKSPINDWPRLLDTPGMVRTKQGH